MSTKAKLKNTLSKFPTTVNLNEDERAQLYSIAADRQKKELKRVSMQSLLTEAVRNFIAKNK